MTQKSRLGQGSRNSERKAKGNMSRENATEKTSDFRLRISTGGSSGRCIRRPRGWRVARSLKSEVGGLENVRELSPRRLFLTQSRRGAEDAEVRVKKCAGTVPAEFDIVERLNGDPFVYHTVHSGWTLNKKHPNEPPHGGKGTIRNGHWNVYGLEITPTELVWSVNGMDTFHYPKTNCGDPDQWQFYMPHFFLLDMQLGGKWVDDVELSTLPVEMQIDYICIYEK